LSDDHVDVPEPRFLRHDMREGNLENSGNVIMVLIAVSFIIAMIYAAAKNNSNNIVY
jgi:hypothetical protein